MIAPVVLKEPWLKHQGLCCLASEKGDEPRTQQPDEELLDVARADVVDRCPDRGAVGGAGGLAMGGAVI